MEATYFNAVGRRKTAVAQVRLYPSGKGIITVNGMSIEQFFTTEEMRGIVQKPLKESGQSSADITIKTSGGGIMGQADASRLGIARALISWDEAIRTVLKAHGLLTRDPRKKERKQFGHRGARRSPQWRKR